MPSSYNVHLVVPSNRPAMLRVFLDAWLAEPDVWRKVHVVYDAPFSTAGVTAMAGFDARGTEVASYAWEDIDSLTGPAREIFSRRDSAIRCFGFLKAYRDQADYVITIDDDCLPPEGQTVFQFVYSHLTAFHGTRRWVSTVPGHPVRGLPFKNLGMVPVDLNMGLWTRVADLSAPEQLVRTCRGESLDLPLPPGRRVMARGQYAPLSGMNLAFTRRCMPFMYFPPMGEGQPYSRFDDIWCGVVAQKVMDHLGWNWTCGEPFVRHERASDPLVNLAKEAPGIPANEKYWEAVHRVKLTADTAVSAVREVADGLIQAEGPASYLTAWGRGLLGWCRLLDC